MKDSLAPPTAVQKPQTAVTGRPVSITFAQGTAFEREKTGKVLSPLDVIISPFDFFSGHF